jgi:hypothetical protein
MGESGLNGFIMKKVIRHVFLLFCVSIAFGEVTAEQVTKEQIKGLDEQVQDIKKDVLRISAELNQLEETLLFPSNTQIAFFVSLAKGSGFEPDAIKLKLDDKDIAHHIYSYKEVDALRSGGVQRVFTGNVRRGQHSLQVSIIGKVGGSKKTDSKTYTLAKGVGPQFVEIRLNASGIEFRDW